MWQRNWIFNIFDDYGKKAAEKGGVPWLRGPGGGTLAYHAPWNAMNTFWPQIEDCSFDGLEMLVAEEVRATIAGYIRWKKECDAEENIFLVP